MEKHNLILALCLVTVPAIYGMEEGARQKQEQPAKQVRFKKKKWDLCTDFDNQAMEMAQEIIDHDSNKPFSDLIDNLIDLQEEKKSIANALLLEGTTSQTKLFALYIAHALNIPYFVVTAQKIKNTPYGKLIKAVKAHPVQAQEKTLPIIIIHNLSKKISQITERETDKINQFYLVTLLQITRIGKNASGSNNRQQYCLFAQRDKITCKQPIMG